MQTEFVIKKTLNDLIKKYFFCILCEYIEDNKFALYSDTKKIICS